MKKAKILAIITVIAIVVAPAALLWSCKDGDGENTLGEGATSFKLEITDKNGKTETYTVKTDEATVGGALIKIGFLPEGSTYVETLNGITADFAVDEGWWKFSVDGKSSDSGVFDVEVKKNAVYSFVYSTGMDGLED